MNFTRSSIWLHSCQGILLSSQKALLCIPCLRNELSPFSQEGHMALLQFFGSSIFPENRVGKARKNIFEGYGVFVAEVLSGIPDLIAQGKSSLGKFRVHE